MSGNDKSNGTAKNSNLSGPHRRGPGRSWAPGVTGNPNGRPRNTPEMLAALDAARAASPEMVAILLAIARDAGVEPSARIRAAVAVLDRALGKPGVTVNVARITANVSEERMEAMMGPDVPMLPGGGQ